MSKMLDRIYSVHMLCSTSAIKCRTIFTMEEIFRTSFTVKLRYTITITGIILGGDLRLEDN